MTSSNPNFGGAVQEQSAQLRRAEQPLIEELDEAEAVWEEEQRRKATAAADRPDLDPKLLQKYAIPEDADVLAADSQGGAPPGIIQARRYCQRAFCGSE